MIKGYVDTIGATLIAGWLFDERSPDTHLCVDLRCDGQLIATVVADEFRADLATANVGNGDHAFRFVFDIPLSEETLSRFLVLARHEGNQAVEIPRWLPKAGVPPKAHDLTLTGDSRDTEQRPVFVLGAARSGTSAVTQALLRSTNYRGNQEGHLIQLIAGLDAAIDQHYKAKADEILEPRRNTMIKMVSPDYFRDGVAALHVAAMRQLFPRGLWLDKTPEHPMISLAPRLLEIWPCARFIFMRRRVLENLASRRRKYPDSSIIEGCALWNRSMTAWAEVRRALAGKALELDQLCLVRRPTVAAAQLGALLDFDEHTTAALATKLAEHRPEQTADDLDATLDAADLGLTTAEWDAFGERCDPWMAHFNYSRDRGYFASDRPENWFAWV